MIMTKHKPNKNIGWKCWRTCNKILRKLKGLVVPCQWQIMSQTYGSTWHGITNWYLMTSSDIWPLQVHFFKYRTIIQSLIIVFIKVSLLEIFCSQCIYRFTCGRSEYKCCYGLKVQIPGTISRHRRQNPASISCLVDFMASDTGNHRCNFF